MSCQCTELCRQGTWGSKVEARVMPVKSRPSEGCSPRWPPASLRCNSHIPPSLLSCFTRSVAAIDFPPACPHPYSLAMQYGVAVIRNPLRLPPHYADFIKGWDLDFASTFPIAVFVTHPYSSPSFLVLNKNCLLFMCQYYKMSFWF